MSRRAIESQVPSSLSAAKELVMDPEMDANTTTATRLKKLRALIGIILSGEFVRTFVFWITPLTLGAHLLDCNGGVGPA